MILAGCKDSSTTEVATSNAPPHVGLRLITWNMEWLSDEPGHGTVKRDSADYSAMAEYAQEIDPDIAVLQEVENEAAVAKVFDPKRYSIYVTHETGVQRVAIVWKHGIDLTVVGEVEALGPGRLRESPDVYVKSSEGNFRLLGVHLKSGCFSGNSNKKACLTLRDQMAIVKDWMDKRQAEGVPYVVAGDFNRRFSASDDFWQSLDNNNPADFNLVAPSITSTANCRDGKYRDFIDHIVMSKSFSHRMVPDSFKQWNYKSWNPPVVSDHCAIGIYLR